MRNRYDRRHPKDLEQLLKHGEDFWNRAKGDGTVDCQVNADRDDRWAERLGSWRGCFPRGGKRDPPGETAAEGLDSELATVVGFFQDHGS